jgi:antitoxin ParD1/3/4
MREALSLMEHHKQAQAAKLQWLQRAYGEGVASGDAGEVDFAALKAEARATMS